MNKEMQKLINALEILNQEYIELKESKEFKIGRKIINNIERVKKKKSLSIVNDIKAIKLMNKYNSLCTKNSANNSIDYSIIELDEEWKPKVAVYTCIVGNYDNLIEPLFKNDNFDFFAFTDNPNIVCDGWNLKKIPENLKGKYNNILINRYIKLHPYEFFNEYDFVIYIDGNIRLISDIRPMVLKARNKLGIAMHKHRHRECVYQEAEVCKLIGKGNANKLAKQIENYKKNGFPENFGLAEANMIISDVKNPESKKIFKKWWEELIYSESLRDQIALPYVIWKSGYSMSDIGDLGENIYKNYKLQINKHI